MDKADQQDAAMLRILLATSETALEVLCPADHPLGMELCADLEGLIGRTRFELEHFASPS